MKHTVIKAFTDLQDGKHVYRPGDVYPHQGTSSDARIAELSSTVNKQGTPLIQSVDGETQEFPVHVGGGYYELSDGERVKGKSAAHKAEKALAE